MLKENKKWLADQTGVKGKYCTAPLFYLATICLHLLSVSFILLTELTHLSDHKHGRIAAGIGKGNLLDKTRFFLVPMCHIRYLTRKPNILTAAITSF